MRDDYQQFIDRDTEIIAIGPEDAEAFKRYWEKETLPFIGLPNPDLDVLKRYGQEVSLFRLGRMPAMVLVDKPGTVRFVHYANSMADIPANRTLLNIIDTL